MPSTKTYYISGKTIHCPRSIETLKDGKEIVLSNAEKTCKSLENLEYKISHNSSRMKKLADEYKCSESYIKKESDTKPMPDCNSYIYRDLEKKFSDASKTVNNLKNQLSKNIDLNNLRHLNNEAEKALNELASFTNDNLHQVNNAFDLALFDTNTAKYGSMFSMLFPPLAFGILAANSMFNNEFDGKIARALDDNHDAFNSISEIGQLLSGLHGDNIYA